MQLTDSNANVQDDAENVEIQQQFSEVIDTIKQMNLPTNLKV